MTATQNKHKTPLYDATVKERRWRTVLTTCVVLLFVGVSGLALVRYADDRATKTAAHRIDTLEAERDVSGQKIDALAEQVVRLGGKPVVTPNTTGTPPTISQQQANIAYLAYCESVPTRCKGPAGKSLTAADALVAINRYCSRSSQACKGSPSQADVLNAVEASCRSGRIDCRGSNGAKGEPGTSVTSISCQPEGFVFTLSDGTKTGPLGNCAPKDGKDGATGATGPPGEKGDTGDSGVATVETDPGCSNVILSPSLSLEYDAINHKIVLHCS